jgi:hypothetical protein
MRGCGNHGGQHLRQQLVENRIACKSHVCRQARATRGGSQDSAAMAHQIPAQQYASHKQPHTLYPAWDPAGSPVRPHTASGAGLTAAGLPMQARQNPTSSTQSAQEVPSVPHYEVPAPLIAEGMELLNTQPSWATRIAEMALRGATPAQIMAAAAAAGATTASPPSAKKPPMAAYSPSTPPGVRAGEHDSYYSPGAGRPSTAGRPPVYISEGTFAQTPSPLPADRGAVDQR